MSRRVYDVAGTTGRKPELDMSNRFAHQGRYGMTNLSQKQAAASANIPPCPRA